MSRFLLVASIVLVALAASTVAQLQVDCDCNFCFNKSETNCACLKSLYQFCNVSAVGCSVPACSGCMIGSVCNVCPAGWAYPNMGTCNICPEGTFAQQGDDACSPCPPGSYCPGEGVSQPTPCPEETPVSGEKATSASDCHEADNDGGRPAWEAAVAVIVVLVVLGALGAGAFLWIKKRRSAGASTMRDYMPFHK